MKRALRLGGAIALLSLAALPLEKNPAPSAFLTAEILALDGTPVRDIAIILALAAGATVHLDPILFVSRK